MNVLLKAIELPYRGINRLRRWLYRVGALQGRRLPSPVISIGNIAAGGAGKTPATIAVARHLIAKGYRVAVLTRGYGRSGAGGVVDSLDAARFGDEPVLIKKSAPEAAVIVGSNRYENGVLIKCDVYLLDDGFQHLQLHRDLDVVIDVEGARFHREGRSALRDAGVVIRRDLRLTVPSAAIGAPCFAFAGLADNDQFFQSLRQAGVQLAGTRSFPDHHPYSPRDLEEIRAEAGRAGASLLLTTEKDAVKLAADDIIAAGAEMYIAPEVLHRIETIAGPVRRT